MWGKRGKANATSQTRSGAGETFGNRENLSVLLSLMWRCLDYASMTSAVRGRRGERTRTNSNLACLCERPSENDPENQSPLHRLSSACGGCCMCFVLDPVSVYGPKTKHTQHLPQTDERRCMSTNRRCTHKQKY